MPQLTNLQRLLLLLLALVLDCSASPVPLDPKNGSPILAPTRNNTNQIVVEGSPEYNQMVQQQREWSADANGTSVGGGNLTLLSYNGTSSFLSNDTSCPHNSPASCVHSLRDKQIRLMNIRNYVLNTLGYGKVPSSPPIPIGVGSSANKPEGTGTPFSGEIKTFYASCNIPTRVDEDVWTDPDYFHLYFTFPLDLNNSTNPRNKTKSRESNQRGFSTISAKLRLYKIGSGSNAQVPLFETPSQSEPCNETSSYINTNLNPGPVVSTKFSSDTLPAVEEKIRVSVYWYKAPGTKVHYKKKLLDTKMVSVKDSKWIDFDIINAAVPWLDHHDKNFGLVVQVENEDNDLVDPHTYFTNVICPDRDNMSTSNSSVLLEQLTPPQVEICILNTPHVQRQVETTEPPFPFPFQMGQSFSLLSRVAKEHEKANNLDLSSDSDWQNDDLPADPTQEFTTIRPKHKHRHGHGRHNTQNKKPRNQNQNQELPLPSGGLQLDDDHPLRRILATVASTAHNSNSRESRRNSRNSRHHHRQQQSVEDYSGESDRDIIIQKIYITNPNRDLPTGTGSKSNSDSGSSNSRTQLTGDLDR